MKTSGIFARIGIATIAILLSLSVIGCPQTNGEITPPEPTPPEPIDKELAGIRFTSEDGFTREELDSFIDELMALYNNGYLDGMSEYIDSMTFVPGHEGGVSVSLSEDKKGIIITDGARSVSVDLETGRQTVIEARDENGDNGNGNGDITVPTEHIDIVRNNIQFRTSGDLSGFTIEQMASIQAEINSLTDAQLSEMAPYINSWTRKPNVDGGRTINFVGEPGSERGDISSDGTLDGGIWADLTVGRMRVWEERANTQPELVPIANRDGINFYAYSNVPQAHVDAFLANLDTFDSDFGWLSRYIQTWTLTTEDTNLLPAIVDLDPQTDRGIVRTTSTRTFVDTVWWVRDRIIDMRGNVAEPTYIDRESTDSSGNTIRFEVEDPAYFEQFAEEVNALTDEQINRYAAHIDLVIHVEEGGWVSDEGGRYVVKDGDDWVLLRDGTHTLAEDLAYARAYITNENGNGNNGAEPVDFLTLSFEGRDTVLFAAPGIDQATIDAIYADTNNAFFGIFDDMMRNAIVSMVASWTLVEETIDGGWRIVGYDNNRAIVESNTSSTDSLNVAIELFLIADYVSGRAWGREGVSHEKPLALVYTWVHHI